jgi:hypothetical protein
MHLESSTWQSGLVSVYSCLIACCLSLSLSPLWSKNLKLLPVGIPTGSCQKDNQFHVVEAEDREV